MVRSGLTVVVPWLGTVVTTGVRAFLLGSMSLVSTATVTGVSSLVVAVSPLAAGASLLWGFVGFVLIGLACGATTFAVLCDAVVSVAIPRSPVTGSVSTIKGVAVGA